MDNTPDNTPPAEDATPKSSRETSGVLTQIYLSKRLNHQMKWYKARNTEYSFNDSFTLRWTAILMTVSTVTATIGLFVTDPTTLLIISGITAALPALAALSSSFRELYQWERQSNVYHDAILGLEAAKLNLPDEYIPDDIEASDSESTEDQTTESQNSINPIDYETFLRFVEEAEATFEQEANQWGQIIMEKPDDPNNYNERLREANEQQQATTGKTPPPTS